MTALTQAKVNEGGGNHGVVRVARRIKTFAANEVTQGFRFGFCRIGEDSYLRRINRECQQSHHRLCDLGCEWLPGPKEDWQQPPRNGIHLGERASLVRMP